MPKINILDRETAELIAAGEVIERPASVVKELVENSIDAGATAITVEIQHGGVRLIRVTDNGCGIEREDVPKAFLRHATSKVLRPEDLDRIGTLGFRGEALASICAVSECEILTRAAAEEIGTRYTLAGEYAGVLAEADREDSVIPRITRADFERLKAEGVVSGGMLPKLENCLAAVDAGVKRVVITRADALEEGWGTSIV